MFELSEDSDGSSEETADDNKDDDDVSDSSGEDTDENNPRPICQSKQLKSFDPSFHKKKWSKLTTKQQKMISSIVFKQVLAASRDKEKPKRADTYKEKQSNRALSLDRSHFISAMRGTCTHTYIHIQ